MKRNTRYMATKKETNGIKLVKKMTAEKDVCFLKPVPHTPGNITKGKLVAGANL